MTIRDILKTKGEEVISINMDKTLHEAIKVLVKHNIGALLILDNGGKLVGIISERDILRECAERSDLLKKTRIKEVMTKDLIIGVLDDDIEYTMGIMTKNRVRHLPVLDNDQTVGVISIGDVVKAQLHETEYDNRYLKQYMFGH